jgi:BolA protein
MTVAAELERRLTAAFAPSALEIVNESHRHSGHAGDDGSGESHFRITIRAPALAGMGRVERHRAVHRALGADLTGRIHAIALDIG